MFLIFSLPYPVGYNGQVNFSPKKTISQCKRKCIYNIIMLYGLNVPIYSCVDMHDYRLNHWSVSLRCNKTHYLIIPLYYAPRKISGEHIVAALSVRPSVCQSVSPSVRPIRVRPITLLFEVGFQNYFTKMTTMLRRRVARNIWVPTLKVKVTVRPCSKIVSGP